VKSLFNYLITRSFIAYIIPAAIGVIFDFLIFYLLFNLTKSLFFSNFIAFFFSNLINIFIAKNFIFKNKKTISIKKYINIYFLTFLVIVSSTFFIEYMTKYDIDVYKAKILMYGYSYSLNYFIRKFNLN
jgi:putative flippase GtrA